MRLSCCFLIEGRGACGRVCVCVCGVVCSLRERERERYGRGGVRAGVETKTNKRRAWRAWFDLVTRTFFFFLPLFPSFHPPHPPTHAHTPNMAAPNAPPLNKADAPLLDMIERFEQAAVDKNTDAMLENMASNVTW